MLELQGVRRFLHVNSIQFYAFGFCISVVRGENVLLNLIQFGLNVFVKPNLHSGSLLTHQLVSRHKAGKGFSSRSIAYFGW